MRIDCGWITQFFGLAAVCSAEVFQGLATAQDFDLIPDPPILGPSHVSGELLQRSQKAAPTDLIKVVIDKSEVPFEISLLASFEGKLRHQFDNLIECEMPARRVMELANVLGPSYQLRSPYRPQEIGFVSQGVPLSAAERLHDLGVLGKGVDIAVIDLGFDGLTEAIQIGDLPEPKSKVNYASGSLESFTYHGTAVAEIVYEMAPEANLHILRVETEGDLAKAAEFCWRNGIEVINHSVGWFNTNFYDGRGVVCEIARRASERGILWVNAAGNSAQRHFEGPFIDTDGDRWCEFSTQDEGIEIVAVTGTPIRLALTWSSWDTRDSDLDLYLLNATGDVVASSTGSQGGGQPAELLDFRVQETGAYQIAVRHRSGRSDVAMELYSLTLDIESKHRVPSSSLVSPGDAPEVLTVGAVHWTAYDTGPQERFSSQGPNNAGHPKPDLVGPDSVNSSIYGIFSGTSAAAPHVAGAAALLLSSDSLQTIVQVRQGLNELAIPLGDANVYGAGNLWVWDDLSPWPDPVEFTQAHPSPKNAVFLQSEVARDPSLVEYAFQCLNDARFTQPFSLQSEVEVRGLRANTLYEFAIQTRDRSPLVNTSELSASALIRTWIEAPRGLRAESLGSRRLAIEVEGSFTGWGEGQTALLLECEELGEPANRWTQSRSFIFDNVAPNKAFTFFVRTRNADGVVGQRLGPIALSSDAVVPPTPSLTGTSSDRQALQLSEGENPPYTELAIYEAERKAYLRPSGRLSTDPAFYPAAAWDGVTLEFLPEGSYDFRAMARSLSGKMTLRSAGRLFEQERTEELLGEEGQVEVAQSAPVSVNGKWSGLDETTSQGRLSLKMNEVDSREVRLQALGESAAIPHRWYRDGVLIHQGSDRFVDRNLQPNRLYTYLVESLGNTRQVAAMEVMTPAELPTRWSFTSLTQSSFRIDIFDGHYDQIRYSVSRPRQTPRVTDWKDAGFVEIKDLVGHPRVDVHVQVRNRRQQESNWQPVRSLVLPPASPRIVPIWSLAEEEAWLDLTSGVRNGLEMAVWDRRRGQYLRPDSTLSPERRFYPRSSFARLNWRSLLPLQIHIEVRYPGGASARSAPLAVVAPTQPSENNESLKQVTSEAEIRKEEGNWKEDPRALSAREVSFSLPAPLTSREGVFLERSGGEGTVRRPVSSMTSPFEESGLRPNTEYHYRLIEVSDEGERSLGPRKSVATPVELVGLRMIGADWNEIRLEVLGALERLGVGSSKLKVSVEGTGLQSEILTTLPEVVISGLQPNSEYRVVVRAQNLSGEESGRLEGEFQTTAQSLEAPRITFVGWRALGWEWREEQAVGEFALLFKNDDLYLSPEGELSPRPIWAEASQWGFVPVKGLVSGQAYEFELQRRGVQGERTPVGENLIARTKSGERRGS